jgi:thioredoxin-dependent peroxiredoxin
MTNITLKGKPIRLSGSLPALHIKAADFKLVDKDLKDRSLHEFQGKRKIIATVPSLDTSTCSTMTKHFNEFAKKNPNVMIITVSADLPFAQKRFCEAENVQNVLTLSMMRNKDFGKSYGILIEDGPLAGILARSVTVLDEKDHVLYTELVPEITEEPNYHKALEALQGK